MPRLARLDAPGVLHPVMGRGIERRKIFRSDIDRNDFTGRLSALAKDGAMEIYAWVLMPNHICFVKQKICLWPLVCAGFSPAMLILLKKT